ncbi:MAG: homoserine O-acetyltransferase [Gemmatimonadales bacterium]
MTAVSSLALLTADFDLGDFTTAGGEVLPNARLRYRVYGDPSLGRTRGWTLVFHALTGSHEVDRWWGPLFEPGGPLDPAHRPVIAANLLGSCYGSTGPAPETWDSPVPFPGLTTADLARAHVPLLAHLGVERVALATGGSLGGMVALQWAREAPIRTDRVVVFAAPAATSAQSIAWNATQRMAIEADPAWNDGHYAAGEGPTAGLAAARAIAMITYRSGAEFDQRFGRRNGGRPLFEIDNYLRYQGEKLVARFDAASYVALTHIMDSHTVGDLPTAARATTARVGEIVGVGIDTDILYYPSEVRDWVEAYRAAGARARYVEIASVCGHDAFLIEWDQVVAILRDDGREG